jgi:small-conductance mechanosensitive channel
MKGNPIESSRFIRQPAGRVVPRFVLSGAVGILAVLPLAAAPLLPLAASPSPAQSATNTLTSDQLAAQLRSRLAETQVEIGRLLAAQAGSTNALPAAAAVERIEYQTVLQATLRAYERQLDDLAGIEAAKQRQRDLAETSTTWTGFAEPPPYSILLVDNLRDSVSSLTASVETAKATCDVLEKLEAEARQLLKQSDSRLRSLNEQFESAADPEQKAQLTWQRSFETARNRLMAANAAGYDRRRQKAGAEVAEDQQRLELARRQLALASQHVRFSQADLDKVLAGLESNRCQLDTEYQAAKLGSQAAQRAREAAREDLRQAWSGAPVRGTNNIAPADRVAALEQLVGVRTVQAETASHRLNLARQLLDLAAYERALWQTRFTTFGSTDPTALRQGYRRLENLQRLIQMAKPYFTHQLDLAVQQISEEQEGLQNRPEALRDPALAGERVVSFTEREGLFRSALRSVEKTERLLMRWKESLDHDRQALPLVGRIRDLFSEFSSFAVKFWNFELFAAEDTITVDGQTITGRRSVTVGKVVRAILILVVGYVLASWFTRLLERISVRRFKFEPNQASLIRRWLRVVVVICLIMLSLMWVKIPLTVFAFLGGALAIGLGFGTQNLLKNFISGIIILFERPFRVGDVLDVESRQGRVTGIGLRSSVIEFWDGTETLIPNSLLLETNLTNWTYSNRAVRFSVSVGAAYGSDTRRVAQVLGEIAERHGLVLKEPKPLVLFKDFGDSALLFELRYWVDVARTNSAQVASDLRHMIANTFADHAIVISFPQRDVHLDSNRPLRVEVVPVGGSGPAQPDRPAAPAGPASG